MQISAEDCSVLFVSQKILQIFLGYKNAMNTDTYGKCCCRDLPEAVKIYFMYKNENCGGNLKQGESETENVK